MAANWTFGRKIALGFAAAAVVLLVVALVGYRSTYTLIANDELVEHTHQVRRELDDLLSTMKDAETGQRGFVITGDEAYLEPYLNALAAVDKIFEQLHALNVDNPIQGRRLDAMRPFVDSKLAELKETIELRRHSGFDATLKVVVEGRGKRFMDEVRKIAKEMDDEEKRVLEERKAGAQQSSEIAKAVMLWGSVLGMILVSLVGTIITRSLSAQIGTAVNHVQSSSAELQAAATQQATGAKEQATAMSEITTTINELLATSRQIAESSQRVAQIAERAVAAARTGDLTVEKGNESVQAIRRHVETIVGHMLELGKKSQQIGTVLDIVSELAEQTNILAINATIEAAGAGDAGKRFAVVADEIRKLADRVAMSTKEIRGLIDDVRSAVNTSVMTTETGSKAAESGARQFADVASAFKQIVGLVMTTTEAAKEIELSTKQQSTAVEQVNIAIANVAQTTRETEASSSQTQATAAQLAGLSNELLRLVQPKAA